MLDYTIEQAKKIIKHIVGSENIDIVSIGNHELNRHLVYLINAEGKKPMVIKFYYKVNRWNREIAALRLLSQSNVKCTKIVNFGKLDDGTEWMLSDYIEGEPYDKVMPDISLDDRLKIFEEMGRELGKIHCFKTFDFYGNWDENGNSIDSIKDCMISSIISTEYSIRYIQQQELPNKDLLSRAIVKVRNSYRVIKNIKDSRLRHNDFDGRNILVKKNGNKWELSGVIDFEQSTPGNIDMDIAGMYSKYFLDNKNYEQAFLKGYNEYWQLSEEFYSRLDFYLLCIGINICSWAYTLAPEYYNDGIRLVSMFTK